MFGFFEKQPTPEETLESLEAKRAEFSDVLIAIHSVAYKKHILEGIKEAKKALKNAYDCESLEELAFNKGKYEAFKNILDIHEDIEMHLKNLDYEIETLKQGK